MIDVSIDVSGKRDSNSRPQPWQGCALPTELFPQVCCNKYRCFLFAGAKIDIFFKISKDFGFFSCFFDEKVQKHLFCSYKPPFSGDLMYRFCISCWIRYSVDTVCFVPVRSRSCTFLECRRAYAKRKKEGEVCRYTDSLPGSREEEGICFDVFPSWIQSCIL